jgi:hypothetical protein
MMLARFLRDEAWRRLDSPGVNAIRVARSVVALLDTAARLGEIPDSHPDLDRLARAGCFRGGVFDPGEAGLAVVRGWELADQPAVPRRDLVAALAVTASASAGLAPLEPVHHEVPPAGPVPASARRHGPSLQSTVPLQGIPYPGSALHAAPR